MTAVSQKELNPSEPLETDEEDSIALPFHGVLYVRRDMLLSVLTEALARAQQQVVAVTSAQQPSDSIPDAPSEWSADAAAFGSQLRERRTAAGLTREQLSRQSGIASSTIRNIESLRHHPTATTRRRLMQAFERLHIDS